MLLLPEKVILHKQFIMDQNKNLNRNETKHHLNTNQLCVFSHFAVIRAVIFNVKEQYVTGFQFERNFVKII